MLLSLDLSKNDRRQIDDIYWKHHSENFYIPNPMHCLTLASAKIGERVVAFGMAKLFPEAILIMDDSATKREKVEAFRLLLKHGIEVARSANYEYLNATIHDEKYCALLEKHYGFKPATGKQVSLEL